MNIYKFCTLCKSNTILEIILSIAGPFTGANHGAGHHLHCVPLISQTETRFTAENRGRELWWGIPLVLSSVLLLSEPWMDNHTREPGSVCAYTEHPLVAAFTSVGLLMKMKVCWAICRVGCLRGRIFNGTEIQSRFSYRVRKLCSLWETRTSLKATVMQILTHSGRTLKQPSNCRFLAWHRKYIETKTGGNSTGQFER